MTGTAVHVTYGTAAVAITATGLASLATGAAYELAPVDNSSNLFMDVLIQAQFKVQTGTPSASKSIQLLVAGTVDPTTPVWPDTVAGSAGSLTLNSPTQLLPLGTIYAPTSTSTPWKSNAFSVAQAFGGTVPTKFVVVVVNDTGMTFSATGSDHKVIYQGNYATSG